MAWTLNAQTDHFSGAIWSTACPVKVGGAITLAVHTPTRTITARVDDDGTVTTLTGTLDSRDRFTCRSADGTTLTGRIRTIKAGSFTVFTGTGRDENCRYRFQGRYRRTISP